MRNAIIENYAPRIEPDEFGRHFVWAFNFVRDQALHFPWFMRDPEHRLSVPVLLLKADSELLVLQAAVAKAASLLRDGHIATVTGGNTAKATAIAGFLAPEQ